MLLGSLLCLLAVTAWDLCFLSWQTPYSLSIHFSSQRFAMHQQLLFFLFCYYLPKGQSHPLRKENTFVTLYGTVGFCRVWFSRFLRTTTCRTFRSHPCRDDSVSYATHRFIIAVDNKNKRPQNYTFLCMFVALFGVMLVISKGNIHLLFELPVTSQQIYLCYAALLAGSFIQTVVLIFNLGHHSDIRR